MYKRLYHICLGLYLLWFEITKYMLPELIKMYSKGQSAFKIYGKI